MSASTMGSRWQSLFELDVGSVLAMESKLGWVCELSLG